MDLLVKRDNQLIIGEIKSTTRRLDSIQEHDRPEHLAQAKLYGFLCFLKQLDLDTLVIQLIYCDLSGTKTKTFEREYTRDELQEFMSETMTPYIHWYLILQEGMQAKLQTKKELAFPFGDFRRYQRELSGSVYHCITNKKNLLLRAPTGIGKTMGTLYPAIKALRHGDQKIFYLTAKTIGRDVAEKASAICQAHGFHGRAVTLTAKEKICFLDEMKCDPESCKYAKNYFDKINEATRTIYTEQLLYNRETIETYAQRFEVCPFEYSLDLATISDIIIADYNYMFDPRAHLQRFFSEPSTHIALIDEAHNLYDRACEMFSANLNKEPVSELYRFFRERDAKLEKALYQLHLKFIELRRKLDDANERDVFECDIDYKLSNHIENCVEVIERYLYLEPDTDMKQELMTLYFELYQFLRIADFFTTDFLFRLERLSADVKVSIVCLNPSANLVEKMKLIQSSVLFSATLHPMNYFEAVLLHHEPAEKLFIPSPFEREHLALTVNTRISTKYRQRPYSIEPLAHLIHEMTQKTVGNYLVFFPSHEYLEQVLSVYETIKAEAVQLIRQERLMNEAEREQFLASFVVNPIQTLVGFCVLGGIFSEGIDLTESRLIGALVVGVGLPQVNPLTEARRTYFQEQFEAGYEYAYVYPGFNKVMQAVGRVIRTEQDTGVVTLVDDRYQTRTYLSLFPHEWQHAKFN